VRGLAGERRRQQCVRESEGRKRDIFMLGFNREIQTLTGYFAN
jgi:hypothetical protein